MGWFKPAELLWTRPRLGCKEFFVLGMTTFALLLVGVSAPDAKIKLEQTKEKMRALVTDKASVDQKQKEMRKLTGELLDFDYVAEQTLGESYAKLAPKQKKEFATTIQELVEASYVSKINDANTSDIKFGEASVVGDAALVKATADAQGSEVHLEFKMVPHGTSWLVQDVVIDDVSLIRNYRSQFQKQLSKITVADLQKKIQKKVAELKASKTAEPSDKQGKL